MSAVNTGYAAVGYTLVIYCCSNVVLTAPAMFLADMQGHYAKKGDSIPGTLGGTVPALIVLIALPF